MCALVPIYVQAQSLNIAFLTLSSMKNVEQYSETKEEIKKKIKGNQASSVLKTYQIL